MRKVVRGTFWRVLMVAVALVVGCREPSSGTGAAKWKALDPGTLSPAQTEQVARADRAWQALAGQLRGELIAALGTGNVPEAIAVCSKKAPAIARSVSQAQSLRIGRTSFRVRNPANAPAEWARPFVDQQTAARVILKHDDGTLALLQPIQLNSMCLTCHGSRDQIDAGVLAKLKELYPDDRATGYKNGDLRGYFWVEVPPN